MARRKQCSGRCRAIVRRRTMVTTNIGPLEVALPLAWSELRVNPGRFLLVTSVVASITLLVTFLTALTMGLAGESVSAVTQFPGDRTVVATTDDGPADLTTSELTAEQIVAWQNAPGVDAAWPLTIATLPATLDGGTRVPVTMLGLPPDARTEPWPSANAPNDAVVLSNGAADALGARDGDLVTVADTQLTVVDVATTGSLSHSPAIYVTPATANTVAPSTAASALLVSGTPVWEDVAAESGTAALTTWESMLAVPSFKGEAGSLGLIIGMLVVISAIVSGAFFAITTQQRLGSLAVLRALGVPATALRRDALGQAAVVTGLGLAIGAGLGLAASFLAATVMPIVTTPLTVVLPLVGIAILSLAGAAAATRSVTRVDPLEALGAHA